ncbi:hypothetical protein [Polymorphospora sp. NPDC050346]|uniref:hypothetical protein n=1 Tax=Polymorphospora sp. NPDC050346 TaxID=3155780 RepID=UPI003405679A
MAPLRRMWVSTLLNGPCVDSQNGASPTMTRPYRERDRATLMRRRWTTVIRVATSTRPDTTLPTPSRHVVAELLDRLNELTNPDGITRDPWGRLARLMAVRIYDRLGI